MYLVTFLKSIFRPYKQSRTEETIEASRAVRRIVTTYSEEGNIESVDDIRTVDRVLAPPVDWQDLLRKPNKSAVRNGR